MTMRHNPTSSRHAKMTRMWIATLDDTFHRLRRHSLEDEDLNLDVAKSDFITASTLLKIGWRLISKQDPTSENEILDKDEKKRSSSSSACPSSCWWLGWRRFTEFAEFATELVARSRRRHLGIYKNENLNLVQCLDHVAKYVPRSKIKEIRNPDGWETMEIAPQLFAKSICILTGASHDLLGTKNQANLSFLLSRLERTLKLRDAWTTP